MAEARAAIDALGVETAEELAGNEEALERLRTYKDLLDDRAGLGGEIEALESGAPT